MDNTSAPLLQITQVMEEMFPLANADLVVNEAHSTGTHSPEGRGRVALFGLEDKILARLVTFGKALATTGAVVLTTELISDCLLNYARPLIYITSLSMSSVIAADASLHSSRPGCWISSCFDSFPPPPHLSSPHI
ncbi:hypothetical protein BKA70DRAFT_193316 [Coprinopsis sp. MPI-PUGE-AT-0042]|nr:hypothetical protein BKA70DRAFT_193316 [Coprinopsis sp. MPI-PUGE-AT-0042]